MNKIYHRSGRNGTLLQIEEDNNLIFDLDSVSDPVSDEIYEVLEKYAPGGFCIDGYEWVDEPIFSDLDDEELAEYIGDD